MKIQITPEKTIGDIQTAFHEEFPYLKLVFFSKPHRAVTGTHAKFLIEDWNTKIGDMVAVARSGFLTLLPNTRTFDIERIFENEFGLFVQVMRKSGDMWLITTVTDQLTLEEQNAKGRASEHVNFLPEDEYDYREQE
ncbi:MAG: hypothetical protein ABMA02_19960 [Saprospiraceae bacterium]